MKVAQNDETNPDTQPVHLPRIPNLSNSQLSPSGYSARKGETPGILSRMFPPFTGITSYRVRAPLAPLLVLSCIVLHLFALYSLFLPPLFFRQTPRPTPLLPSTTTVLMTPLSCQSNQACPPLDHQISSTLFLLLALEQCSMLLLSVNPILMHSLTLLLHMLIPYLQSKILSIGCQFIIIGPTFLSVCLAILLGRDHSGGDHGYILYIHTYYIDGD